jgi:adenylate cyclase
VLAHSGVLVDYIGDEVIAMWGAPKEEPAHARLACRAALDMLAKVPEINARWQGLFGEPMGLGIGINTGVAQVGNTGSAYKFKYGALGNTVNLASRVQGATKYLKTGLLVTGSTRARLDSNFATRLLCRVAVVNIAEPVDLYELTQADRPGWDKLRHGYEEALALFDRRDFRATAQRLGNLLAEFPDDGPSLLLLSRAVECLVHDAAEFEPVWRLPGK